VTNGVKARLDNESCTVQITRPQKLKGTRHDGCTVLGRMKPVKLYAETHQYAAGQNMPPKSTSAVRTEPIGQLR